MEKQEEGQDADTIERAGAGREADTSARWALDREQGARRQTSGDGAEERLRASELGISWSRKQGRKV